MMKPFVLSLPLTLILGFYGTVIMFGGCSQAVPSAEESSGKDPQPILSSAPSPRPVSWDSSGAPDLPSVDLPASMSSSNHDLEPPASVEASSPEGQPILRHVQLDSRIFLSKAGILLGDFTVRNQNPDPITEVRIACAEYDSFQILLKSTDRVVSAHDWIGSGTQQFFGAVEFDYVDDAFDTVTCRLQSVKTPDSTVSIH